MVLDRGVVASKELDGPDPGQPGQPRGPARQPPHHRPGDHGPARRHRAAARHLPRRRRRRLHRRPRRRHRPLRPGPRASDPPVCTQGYEGTQRTDPNRTTDLPRSTPAPGAPRRAGRPASVRGAQNAPGPSRPGYSNASVPLAIGDQPVSPGTGCVVGHGNTRVSVPLPPSGGGQQRAVVAVDHEGGCSMSTITTQAGRAVTISRAPPARGPDRLHRRRRSTPVAPAPPARARRDCGRRACGRSQPWSWSPRSPSGPPAGARPTRPTRPRTPTPRPSRRRGSSPSTS